MMAFIEKSPADKFLRIHRSHIIPLSKIVSVINRKVLLTSGKTFPVCDTYAALLTGWINKK